MVALCWNIKNYSLHYGRGHANQQRSSSQQHTCKWMSSSSLVVFKHIQNWNPPKFTKTEKLRWRSGEKKTRRSTWNNIWKPEFQCVQIAGWPIRWIALNQWNGINHATCMPVCVALVFSSLCTMQKGWEPTHKDAARTAQASQSKCFWCLNLTAFKNLAWFAHPECKTWIKKKKVKAG